MKGPGSERNGPERQQALVAPSFAVPIPGLNLYFSAALRRSEKRVLGTLFRHFEIAAEGIGQLHLPRGTALGFEELWRAHQERQAFGPGRGDIETVETVEEFHSPRRTRVA